jgi:hypothetical protein
VDESSSYSRHLHWTRVSSQLEAPTALPGGNVPRIVHWVGPRAGLVVARRTFTPFGHQTPAVRLVCGC